MRLPERYQSIADIDPIVRCCLNEQQIRKRELTQRLHDALSSGESLAEVCRSAMATGDTGPGDLIEAMIDGFGVPLSDVTLIGGWDPGGSGEIDDETLNSRLRGVLRS